MADDESPKNLSFIEKLQADERFNRGIKFLRSWWTELLCGCLMFIGLVFAFFYRYLGGLFVGLAVGIYFFNEIRLYALYVIKNYSKFGLIKILMGFGIVLYLLIATPTFALAVILAAVVTFLINQRQRAL